MDNICITIGREFGSGGREVGKKLCENLGMKYYDKELIELVSQESGIAKDVFENVDEKRSIFFTDGIVAGQGSMLGNFYSFSDNLSSDSLYIHKMDVIKKIADNESAIIVGRCADYILREYNNVFSVFIHCSDIEKRKARVREHHTDIEEKGLTSFINKTDKQRASYYNFYTDQKWGESKNYNLSIDTAKFGIDGAVAIIEDVVRKFFKL